MRNFAAVDKLETLDWFATVDRLRMRRSSVFALSGFVPMGGWFEYVRLFHMAR